MKASEQAQWLRDRIVKAQIGLGKITPAITESEVCFRFGAVEGVLIMAANEVNRLVELWEDKDAET